LHTEEQIIFQVLNEEGIIEKPNSVLSSLLNEKFNIDFCFQYLQKNRLIPLFFERSKVIHDLFPQELTTKLKEANRNEIFRMMKMEGIFKTIMPLLSANDIKVIVLKGMALAHTVYSHPHLRPMTDIDLLVHPQEYQRATDILTTHGAKLIYANESKYIAESNFDVSFSFQGIKVELHHHLMPPNFKTAINRNTIFDNTKKTVIAGISCSILTPEIQLFHLLHHLSRHMDYKLTRLIWLVDIHLFLNKYEPYFQWKKFFNLIELAHSNNDIYHSLILCNEFFKDKLPLDIPKPTNISLLKDNYLQLCKDMSKPHAHIGSTTMIKQIQGWHNKIKYIRGKLFPSTDYVRYLFHQKNKKFIWRFYVLLYSRYISKAFKINTSKNKSCA
jgi:hypothetical protein